jgi:hypothetical protein
MYAPQFGAPPQGYAMPPYDFDHHTTPPMSPSPATSYYSPRHAPQFTQASPRTSPGPGKTSDYGNQLSAANPFVRQQRNPIHDFSSSEDTPGVPVRKPIRHTWPEKVSNYQNQMPVLQAGNFVDTSHRRPKGVSPESLASKLSRHFTGRDSARGPYSDADIREISTLLKRHAPKWCKTPRIYIILRTIGSLDLLDRCIDVGFSDYWLPVTERNLPDFLRPSIRTAFAEAQTLVLTKSMNLEKGAKGQHCYFRKGETLPLETKGILGSGGYGQVDRILSLISFKEYARKRVLRSATFRGRRKEDVTRFIAEIEIMKRLKHCHVVEFVGSYTDAKYIGLIMTPIAEGDLTSYLTSATPEKYPELRTFFGCLATGLEFLHQHNVRHKDIKPGNILINNGQVLFTDFGLSLDFTDSSGSTTMSMVNGMTPRYCAPEVANCEPRNTMSDIWSLGIVFFEMLITLKGKKTEFMDEYFRTHGSGQAFVRFNISAMPVFLAELATLGSRVDDKPSEWIELMLLEDQKLRPTASALVNQITASMTADGGFTFCGICCAGAEEEDFSDYASDSDM